MLILFDHGTPRSIARFLKGHVVVEAIARGWSRLSNGALLKVAEEAGFDILLSTDKNIQYQQNLKDRRIAVVILSNSQRPAVLRHISRVVEAVEAATPGSYTEVATEGCRAARLGPKPRASLSSVDTLRSVGNRGPQPETTLDQFSGPVSLRAQTVQLDRLHGIDCVAQHG